MRTICSMAAGIGVAAVLGSVFAAPAALAEPGAPGYVAVQCQVWAQSPMAFAPGGAFGPGGMGMGMKQWAGTVIGRGPDEGAARADAERQMWGPYGPMPELRDCVPAAG